jgi:hypothetical protein
MLALGHTLGHRVDLTRKWVFCWTSYTRHTVARSSKRTNKRLSVSTCGGNDTCTQQSPTSVLTYALDPSESSWTLRQKRC